MQPCRKDTLLLTTSQDLPTSPSIFLLPCLRASLCSRRLLCAAGPIRHASAMNVIEAINDAARSTPSRQTLRTRSLLLILQIGLSGNSVSAPQLCGQTSTFQATAPYSSRSATVGFRRRGPMVNGRTTAFSAPNSRRRSRSLITTDARFSIELIHDRTGFALPPSQKRVGHRRRVHHLQT